MEHQEWVEQARKSLLNPRGFDALCSYAAGQAKGAKKAQQAEQAASYQLWLAGALSVYRTIKSHEQTLSRPFRDQSALARAYCRLEFWSNIWDATILPVQASLSSERLALRAEALKQARVLAPLDF